MFWQILSLISDVLKLSQLASYFYKRYEASKHAEVAADTPLTNEEELNDIKKLP